MDNPRFFILNLNVTNFLSWVVFFPVLLTLLLAIMTITLSKYMSLGFPHNTNSFLGVLLFFFSSRCRSRRPITHAYEIATIYCKDILTILYIIIKHIIDLDH